MGYRYQMLCALTWLLLRTETTANTYNWGRVISDEYCDYQTFEARCSSGEVIVMAAAEYGHISRGKCVTANLGHFGCKADVLGILDERCSGKQRCTLPVHDEVLRNTRPCTVGILVYLKATYMCVKAVSDIHRCDHIEAHSSTQYISSTQAKSKTCSRSTGQYDQEFSIIAKAGQKISFTLVDLTAAVTNPTTETQQEVGYILDTKSNEVHPILRNGQMEPDIAVTAENTATIALASEYTSNFLIAFHAEGCADLKLSSDVWIRREGQQATVGCHGSQQTWQLRCQNSQWTGVIGNCSLAANPQPILAKKEDYSLPLPRDIIFVIIGCATFFIAVVVVTAGYVSLKWPKRLRQQGSRTLRYRTVKHSRVPSTAGSEIVYLSPRYPPDGDPAPAADGDYQPIWSKPLPRPPNTEGSGTGGHSKRNNEDVYNMSLSSTSTDYERKKYYVLDQDYVNNMSGMTTQ